jgi:hypothetical protein
MASLVTTTVAGTLSSTDTVDLVTAGAGVDALTVGNVSNRCGILINSSIWAELGFGNSTLTGQQARIGMAYGTDATFGVVDGDFYVYQPTSGRMDIVVKKAGGVNICGKGGSVGIGTTNPSQLLHVNGASLLGGSTTIGGNLVGAISGLFDLGTSSFKWRNLALSGAAVIDGTLTFDGTQDQVLSTTTHSLEIKNMGNNAYGGLVLQGGNGTHGLQMYWDGSGYGFLDAAWAEWDIQKVPSGAFKVDEGSGLKRVLTEAGGTFTGQVTIDQHSNANALYIDSESTTHNTIASYGKYGMYHIQDISNGYGLYIHRNLNEAGVSSLAHFIDDHTANTQTTVYIQQDGTGPALVAMGNVGIGTTDPGTYKLKVEGTTWLNDQVFIAGNSTAPPTSSNSQDFGAIRMSGGGSRSMYQGCTSTYGWIQVMSSTNHATNYPLALNPNGGSVGIGTPTPVGDLDICGADASKSPNIKLTGTAGDVSTTRLHIMAYDTDNSSINFDAYLNDAQTAWVSSDAGSNAQLKKTGDKFYINYDSGIAVDSQITWNDGLTMDLTNGNVGIGTASPTGVGSKLVHIKDSSAQSAELKVQGNYAAGLYIENGDARARFYSSHGSNASYGGFLFEIGSQSAKSGTEIVRFWADGDAQFTSTANRHNYHSINTATAGYNPILELTEAGTRRGYINYVSASNYLSITSEEASSDIAIMPAGSVGIGTTAPAYKLDVNGAARIVGGISSPAFWFRPNAFSVHCWQPKGGWFHNQTNVHTGAIRIKLPPMHDAMVTFWVDVYDYADNESFSAYISGYPYQGTTWSWTSAVIIGGAERNLTVRFGDNNTAGSSAEYYVYIGETGSTWNYIQVVVRDVFCGYHVYANEWDGGDAGWGVSFATSFENVAKTQSNTLPYGDYNKLINTPAAGVTGSGTDNYIPKWNGTTALENSVIRDDGSNVYITKSSGLAPLVLLSNPANQVADIGGELIFQATYRATSDTTQVARIKGSRENATTNNWKGKLTFHTSPGGDSPSASTERMRITGDGKVGIGTTAPGIYKLNVSGSVYAGGSVLIPNASYYFGALSSSGALISLMYLNSSNEAIFGSTSLATNGYPIRTLAKYITFEPAGTLGAAVETMRVTNSSLAGVGSVGIGTTNPGYLLDVNGTANVGGALTVGGNAAFGAGQQIQLTKVLANADFDAIRIAYTGSWSNYQGKLAGIHVVNGNNDSSTMGRFGVTYGSGGSIFTVTDLYDGGFGLSGDVFTVRGDGKVQVVNGPLQMGTTTVIDASRNLTGTSATFSGAASALTLGVNIGTSDNTGRGISLYGGAVPGEPTYGLMFQGTATFGTHGTVTGSWATYFTMNSSAGRGWIFRNTTTGNVASIQNNGNATFSGSVDALNVHIAANNTSKLSFWGANSNYLISMMAYSATGAGRLEATSDYNMYFRMTSGTNRGFVFQNGTTNIAQIEGNGNLLVTGKVGIGTTAPSTSLHVHKATGGTDIKISAGNYGTNYGFLGIDSITLGLATGNGVRAISINHSNQYVAIGGQLWYPKANLHVRGKTIFDNNTTAVASAIPTTVFVSDQSDATIGFAPRAGGTEASAIIGIDDSDSDKFKISYTTTDIGAVDHFALNSSGEFGIGTDPISGCRLRLAGGTYPLRVLAGSTEYFFAANTLYFNSSSNAYIVNQSSYLRFGANDYEVMRLSSGKVGIGTAANLNSILNVYGATSSSPTSIITCMSSNATVGGGAGIFFKSSSNTTLNRYGVQISAIRNSSNNGSADLVFNLEKTDATGLAERMRIKGDGNVGIGTTNPGTWKLRVEGAGFFNGSVVIPNASNYFGALNSSGSNKSLLYLSSSNEFIMNKDHGGVQPTIVRGKYVAFETPDSVLGVDIEVMRIFGGVGFMTAGCVGIGVTTPSSKLHVNGTITGTSKNFNIPHPDPSKVNARLIHASIEAPSNDTLYKFEVVISLDNETVTHPLPGYFKYLNKNPRMWIQARNMFSHAYGSCAEDLSSFSITGEKAGSYDVLIIATRRDEGVKDFVVEIDA